VKERGDIEKMAMGCRYIYAGSDRGLHRWQGLREIKPKKHFGATHIVSNIN
jgi:hypothetical protein